MNAFVSFFVAVISVCLVLAAAAYGVSRVLGQWSTLAWIVLGWVVFIGLCKRANA